MISAKLANALRPELPGLADDIIGAIAREVPTYQRPMEGPFGRGVRIGVERALARFVEGQEDDPDLRAVYVELGRGEHKSIATDRVILVPGPAEEVAVVQEVYRLFTEAGKPEREIADLLNARGLVTDLGRPWSRGTVHQLLINEKYVGDNVWARTSFKLKRQHVQNAEDEWIRAEGAFAAIVDRAMFVRRPACNCSCRPIW